VAVLRCVTFADCLPMDVPPPSRLAANTSGEENAIAQLRITAHTFMSRSL
jgi:hypothetical protein